MKLWYRGCGTISFDDLLYESFASRFPQRGVGNGRKGALRGGGRKLFYILFDLKTYPTYDLAGFIFGVDRIRCCDWVKSLMCILQKELVHA